MTVSNQPRGLISVLLNPKAEFGDRSDAAMDLGEFDEPDAFDALMAVATNPEEDADLLDACGESLAEICSRRAQIDPDQFLKLQNPARTVFVAYLKQLRPDWAVLVQASVERAQSQKRAVPGETQR